MDAATPVPETTATSVKEEPVRPGAVNRLAPSSDGSLLAVVGCKRFYLLDGDTFEVIASVAETVGDKLKAKPARVCLPDSHTPMSAALEALYYPTEAGVAAQLRALVR